MTTTDRIVYLVPSRARPHNITELVDAWDTTRDGVAELVIAVDIDDPKLDAYKALDLPAWARLVIGPRLRLGGTLNALAPGLAEVYAGVGFMGDDHRPRSLGWDTELAGELIYAGAVVYGNDLIQGAALPTAVLLDSRIVRALGGMVPAGMVHLWLDNYWLELGRRLGTLRYRSDVIIEHEHPIAGRVAWDDGYREVNDDAVSSADRARLEAHIAGGHLGADVAAILAELRGGR